MDSSKRSNILQAGAHIGRRLKFTADHDFIFIREVFVARAHIVSQCETRELFEVTALKVNACRKLSVPVTWKCAQDRCKRL